MDISLFIILYCSALVNIFNLFFIKFPFILLTFFVMEYIFNIGDNMINKFMQEAIAEAKKAYTLGEIPVGCVIVEENEIIARGHNTRELTNNPINHAEMVTITKASEFLKNWRLSDCDMYVTLEPCVMCAGGILNSRIKNLYFGAYDYKYGACVSNDNIFFTNKEISFTNVYGGIMEEECKKILSDFFRNIR